MCGLAGAIGPVNNAEFLITAIQRMEYRGYDSCGFVLRNMQGAKLWQVSKYIGPPSQINFAHHEGEIGLAHTRWASHGQVCTQNTHPIEGGDDSTGVLCVVHNGIIENYQEIRSGLLFQGFAFLTETDTEPLAHLLANKLRDVQSIEEILLILSEVSSLADGRFSAVAMYRDVGHVNGLFLISKGMPLYVCHQYGLVASDPTAFAGFVPHDSLAVMLENQVAFLGYDGQKLVFEYSSNDTMGCVEIPSVEPNQAQSCRGSRMRSEIQEQLDLFKKPQARNPFYVRGGPLLMFGSGSSYHAALFGTHIMAEFDQESYASLPSQILLTPHKIDNCGFIAITQSGETADTLRVIEPLKNCHVLTNRPDSSAVSMYGQSCIMMDCGPELAVAATKSFTASCLRMLEIAVERSSCYWVDFSELVDSVRYALNVNISSLILSALRHEHIFIAGNSGYYPIALEGALKLKECSYKHAEGIALAEVKHGPLAMMSADTFIIASVTTAADLANLSEITSRNVPVFVLTNMEMAPLINSSHLVLPELKLNVTRSFAHGQCSETVTSVLSPLTHLFILQRLAYELSMALDINPDMPRNIAKSLTV